GMGLWRLLSRRHFRWVGMRLSTWELGVWSFLMSSVHGAGLMLVPVLAHHSGLPVPASIGWAATASLLHAAAMLVTAGVVAVAVLEVLGLGVLRRAWLNVDKVWAVALMGPGAAQIRCSNSHFARPSRNASHSCRVKRSTAPSRSFESRTAVPPSGSGATSTQLPPALAVAVRQSRLSYSMWEDIGSSSVWAGRRLKRRGARLPNG